MSPVDAAIHIEHCGARKTSRPQSMYKSLPVLLVLTAAITMFETIIHENAYLKGKKELKEDGKYLLIY